MYNSEDQRKKVTKPVVLILFLFGLISLVLLVSCGSNQAGDTDEPMISFSSDVSPILNQKCIGCHGSIQPLAGLDLSSYEGIMAGTKGKPVVEPGSSSNSLLVKVVKSGSMPKNGAKLTDDQVEILSKWVDQGASDN